MPDSVVPLGSVVFALIDPAPGHELAFNAWYERDHFYTAGTAAPGVFAAGHFLVAGAPPNVHRPHLALYFVLPDHDDARVAFATDQVRQAADEDRLFTERTHLHTWLYRPAFSWHAAGHDVPTPLALDHPYRAVSVALVDTGDDDELAAVVGGAARGVTGVGQILGLTARSEVMASEWLGPVDAATRRALVFFHTVAPDAAAPALDAVLEGLAGQGGGAVRWSASFHPAVFGTHQHVLP